MWNAPAHPPVLGSFCDRRSGLYYLADPGEIPSAETFDGDREWPLSQDAGRPSSFNFAIIFPIIVGSLIVPRFLQAEMTALCYKIKSSLLFALYDLLGDLAVPYADMLHVNAIRICTRIRDGRWPKAGDTVGIHGLSETSGSSETTRTRATRRKGAALFIKRAGSEIYQSVMRAGRMRSTTSGLSSMASVVDPQSNFMAYDVRPSGLKNGSLNVCFVNSIVQLMVHSLRLIVMCFRACPSISRRFSQM
ncbi:unnamed protein product [Vitrella brassicaformis CCMP3155]|uniref:Uncharacterized protein n=1 Tax=Vitrella brassicaformis (strain CCMP3155) TaxID=1169540 RepID=A0A0G4F4N1_VITBC|nr:unnamed protein product [Vitrella brassicaformis CCMP3155]|eukprot:CEM06771.1 unnamed protein product [Vitrella brassicaformis CCMP3155]